MHLRDNILLQPNAISAVDLASLSDYLKRAQLTDSLVSNFEDDAAHGAVEWVVNRNIRDTHEVQLSQAIREQLTRIDDANIHAYINPFYHVEVSDREPAGILHYGIDGHYIPHVDAETLYKDEEGRDWWEKTLDRDLSIVYFINDDFAAGELFFPELDLVVEPEAGMLVCFPSDHHYIHGVRPVTRGHRYTIVNWMRVKGMPNKEDINQATIDEFNRAWPKQIDIPPRLMKGGRMRR